MGFEIGSAVQRAGELRRYVATDPFIRSKDVMSASTATLIAAVIAAASSFAGLFARKASELRKAHRDTLEPHIQDLAVGIHQAVATSTVIVMTDSVEARENWRARGADAKEKLKGLRVQLRYSLWGLDKALKDLSQVPDWVEHAWDYPEYREKIIERGISWEMLWTTAFANVIGRAERLRGSKEHGLSTGVIVSDPTMSRLRRPR